MRSLECSRLTFEVVKMPFDVAYHEFRSEVVGFGSEQIFVFFQEDFFLLDHFFQVL